jgi:DNA-binding MarR family transcriptional regulator
MTKYLLKRPVIQEDMNVKVPNAEYQVLCALAALGEAHGPKISRAMQGAVSVAAIYKLLARLEKRGLVIRNESTVRIDEDVEVRRVVYHVPDEVRCQLKKEIDHAMDDQKKRAAGRTEDSETVREQVFETIS